MKNESRFLFAHRLLLCSAYFAFCVFLFSCANQVAPTGGAKDVTPPKTLKLIPQNYSTNFKGHDIIINFDEYVQLKDISTQLIVSPPLKYPVKTKIRKKSLMIHLEDTLQQNATYTMNFGNAISDIHEGNVLENFQYVFSTGDVIDSLIISGKIERAFDKKTEKGIYAMLYYVIDTAKVSGRAENGIEKDAEKGIYEMLYHIIDSMTVAGMAESTFDKKAQIYMRIDHIMDSLTMVRKGKKAAIQKTRKGIYAMIYQGEEDSLPLKKIPDYFAKTNDSGFFQVKNVSPGHYKIVALKDNNSNYLFDNNDEMIAFKDSFVAAPSTGVTMELFKELPRQQLLKSNGDEAGKAIVVYSRPLQSAKITFLSNTDSLKIYSSLFSQRKDTLTIWYRNQLSDSLSLIIQHIPKAEIVSDTITIRLRRSDLKGRFKYIPAITTQYETKTEMPLDVGRPLELIFNHPIEQYDLKNISLTEDSTEIKNLNLSFKDSLKQTLAVEYKWKEKTKYSIMIPKGTLTDIFGTKNDSLQLLFKTKSLADYGTLALSIQLPQTGKQYLVQLIPVESGDKENVYRQSVIHSDTILHYEYLDARIYRFKLIEDTNANGEWDTGNYLLHQQPERISYYKESITVRANWDVDVKWKAE